jgi:nitrate/nitrite transporter NarK
MVIGRFIFGLGGENLVVATYLILSQWFLDKELAFALGISIAAGRIGSSANTFITPKLYEQDPTTDDDNTIELPLFVGVIVSAVALLSVIGLYFIDKKSEEFDDDGGHDEATS